MSATSKSRIAKELVKFQHEAPGLGIDLRVVNETTWQCLIKGVDGTLYAGEVFTLSIQFDEKYPYESPIIKFIPRAPVHPHIYTNGHICLDLLYDNWSPAVTVQAVALSIQSMLSSNTTKIPPDGDADYCRRYGPDSNPKKTRFLYHDDTV